MKCPYCLTAVLDEAVVCHACAREFHLFRPLMAKVAELEAREQVKSLPLARDDAERTAPQAPILPDPVADLTMVSRMRDVLRDAATFLVLPLVLLLIAHAVIVVLYQGNLMVLRVIALVLPFAFGYVLFATRHRSMSIWLCGALLLAALAVLGMNATSSRFDGKPVIATDIVSLRADLEFGLSIGLGYFAGMLFGALTFARAHPQRNLLTHHPSLRFLHDIQGRRTLTPEEVKVRLRIWEFLVSASALVMTVLSISAGLK